MQRPENIKDEIVGTRHDASARTETKNKYITDAACYVPTRETKI